MSIEEQKAALYEQADRLRVMDAEMANAANGVYDGNICGQAGYANQYCNRPSTVELIEKEVLGHQHQAKRIAKLAELRDLLIKHPELARILELKRELGL